MMYAHFQRGRATFGLKDDKVDVFLKLVEDYIHNKTQKARDEILESFVEGTDMKFAEFIIDGIGDFPASKEPLIIERTDFEGFGRGVGLEVISIEALENDATPHLSCVINGESASPF
ncbi:hypothetical protein MP638_004093 [Amoeboaphelidium occidentale]|nr:hypothetical protein MP638_004093 [Amoeboaphelidium occidentale]